MSEMVERVARAVREEIVRQFRDNDRAKWPGGTHMYEEHVGPHLIARAAILAMREPTEAMLKSANKASLSTAVLMDDARFACERATYVAAIDEALK